MLPHRSVLLRFVILIAKTMFHKYVAVHFSRMDKFSKECALALLPGTETAQKDKLGPGAPAKPAAAASNNIPGVVWRYDDSRSPH